MTASSRLRGLYAITDASLQAPDELVARVSLAIDGGARLIQYRDKSANTQQRMRQARELAELCARRAVSLIINDDVSLAADCGAHGAHIGRDDSSLANARRILGSHALIGVSCYNELERARRAAEAGADYIAFGRFFPSDTKPEAVRADPGLIRACKQQWPLPVAAIGGITVANAGILLDAGADMLAIVRGVFAASDIRRAAAGLARLFEPSPATTATGQHGEPFSRSGSRNPA